VSTQPGGQPASLTQTRHLLRVILTILVVAGALWIIAQIKVVILMVVLSIFFAYLIAPLVGVVQRSFRRSDKTDIIPRGLAVGIVYLICFIALTVAFNLLLPKVTDQLKDFGTQVPIYISSARGFAQRAGQFYQHYPLPPSVREAVNNTALRTVEGSVGYINNMLFGLVSVLGYLPWLVLVPVIAFFVLKDADSFRRSAVALLPRGRWRWRGDEFFQDINRMLSAYIRAQLIACLLIGFVCSITFSIIGVPYALLIGILAGLLEFIPLVGPLIVAIIAGLLSGFYSLSQAVVVLIFLLVLRIVHDYITYPRIIGQGIHLHPLAIILSILVGAELGGIVGIFLAIPVMAILSVCIRHLLEHHGHLPSQAE
ncbi:MAG: AI-2E family transporter, partial [Pyrinomonadaceae bacterium]